MNVEEFDNLWQETEIQGKAHRLARQYPAWERRQRRVRNGVMAVLVVGALSSATVPLLWPSSPTEYPTVCSNRSDTDDAQWVSLAAEMLTVDLL
jgi:hypothetical protein